MDKNLANQSALALTLFIAILSTCFATSAVLAATGILNVGYAVDDDFDSEDMKVIHSYEGNEEVQDGLDGKDLLYGALFSPRGRKAKIISRVSGVELHGDIRPWNSISTCYLELSLHSQSGSPMTVSARTWLWLELPHAGPPYYYDFGSDPMTIQQYDPNDPNIFYPVYDVRRTINGNSGLIPLSDLDGTYESEVPFIFFKLFFDRLLGDINYDGIVDFADLSKLADNWNQAGVLSGDICGPNGIPDLIVNNYDLMAFCDDWMKNRNDPNTW